MKNREVWLGVNREDRERKVVAIDYTKVGFRIAIHYLISYSHSGVVVVVDIIS